jgi:class 3 adenylate cyclase
VAHIGGIDDVLVSRTVKDLVAGSGIKFEDFGMHTLKGIPEEWQVFRAVG